MLMSFAFGGSSFPSDLQISWVVFHFALFCSFSFLYSTVMVFLFVKPDHTSQNKQIVQISSRMSI